MTSPCDVSNFFCPANHAVFRLMLPLRMSKNNPDAAHIFRELMRIRRRCIAAAALSYADVLTAEF